MRLSLLSLSLADLGRETGLDGGDGSSGAARVARHEVETVLTLVQLGVRATAGLARDVFHYLSVSALPVPCPFAYVCVHQDAKWVLGQ